MYTLLFQNWLFIYDGIAQFIFIFTITNYLILSYKRPTPLKNFVFISIFTHIKICYYIFYQRIRTNFYNNVTVCNGDYVYLRILFFFVSLCPVFGLCIWIHFHFFHFQICLQPIIYAYGTDIYFLRILDLLLAMVICNYQW